MTLGRIPGNSPIAPPARWSYVRETRTIGPHTLALPRSQATTSRTVTASGALVLSCSRGEHAGTY
ncbi:hypothetical protein PSP20601_02496 [Pandoraea sputorum]|uniref:Uncharacterized protein n=1 Tax=Pandoraea sputorum TaxID=93222 RepID=A0A239SNH0_9BURK|nr:Uncharacterised protein [Pandoraea sputorum]VVE07994.1 hypothetical protein PSP20601_02496 [Pandoraea sputorum]